MNQNRLFNQTRWRLAGCYALVMGLILSLCGFAVYKAKYRVHWLALNRELHSVAGTLHDSIEPILQQPGKIEPEVKQFLPNICLVKTSCFRQNSSSRRHILGAVNQENYYVRLFDISGNLIAIAGNNPPMPILAVKHKSGEIVKDLNGDRYYQISVSMHTKNYRPWGYMQV
ncbi:MAG TPA: two-component sensor histidine kinase, partial [Phormidium sp.]